MALLGAIHWLQKGEVLCPMRSASSTPRRRRDRSASSRGYRPECPRSVQRLFDKPRPRGAEKHVGIVARARLPARIVEQAARSRSLGISVHPRPSGSWPSSCSRRRSIARSRRRAAAHPAAQLIREPTNTPSSSTGSDALSLDPNQKVTMTMSILEMKKTLKQLRLSGVLARSKPDCLRRRPAIYPPRCDLRSAADELDGDTHDYSTNACNVPAAGTRVLGRVRLDIQSANTETDLLRTPHAEVYRRGQQRDLGRQGRHRQKPRREGIAYSRALGLHVTTPKPTSSSTISRSPPPNLCARKAHEAVDRATCWCSTICSFAENRHRVRRRVAGDPTSPVLVATQLYYYDNRIIDDWSKCLGDPRSPPRS